MPANTNPIFPATIRTVGEVLSGKEANDSSSLFSSGQFGSAVTKIVACNSHATAAIDVILSIAPAESAVCSIQCGTVTIPALTGVTSAPVSLLPAGLLDADDKLFLGSAFNCSTRLLVEFTTDMPVDMFISFMVMASDY